MSASYSEIIKNTLDSLKAIAETENVVGKPIVNGDGTVILPVSKISFGFVSGGGGGGKGKKDKDKEEIKEGAAVSGGGLTVTPIGFLVCGKEQDFIAVEKSAEGISELARKAFKLIKDRKKDTDEK